MPLTRYQIRNEYSLADPELYKAAERDDPEALLEGVAMAGLVGVLRQLGDLSEFAAEIFHDLHEEVMATAARGHGLMVRVQQLEAEIPSIEKAFLLQTNHTSFHSNAGIDWHPNLHMQQNLITRGDLPRCVMDSYEECRGPPRLFLLDKFDVAGAGACLKRYTDPSFFKVETAHCELSAEVWREKKFRKGKKKGSRWKNGETPEIVPTSHAKLHQLFLEESVEKGRSDPARLVKLKRRQLNASPFDSTSGKSYMEKLLEIAPERNEVREISVSPLPLKLTSDNSSESGQEIYDVTTVSPVKETLLGRRISCSSPNAHEVVEKPSINELYGKVIDRQIVKTPEPSADSERDEIPSSHLTLMVDKEIQVDGEGKREGSVDGNKSEDMTSEVENYVDALTTIESEMETDHEYRPKTDWRFLNVKKHAMDPDRNWEQLELEAHSSDAQSIGNFAVYDDGNSSLKNGRSSFFYSDTLSNLADITPSDSEESAKVFSTSEASGPQSTEMPSNQLPADVAALRDKSRDLLLPNNMCVDEDNFHCHEGVSSNFSPPDSIYPLSPLEPATSSMQYQSAETPSELMIPSSGLSYKDEKETILVDSLEVVSDLPSQTRNGTSFTASAESHSVNKLDGVDPRASSDDMLHSSNNSELASENKSDDDSPDEELQIDFAEKSYPDCTLNTQIDSPWSSSLPKEDRVRFSDLSEVEDSVVEKHEDLFSEVVRDALSETAIDRENSISIVETAKNCSYQEQRASNLENVSQAELESVEKTAVCSAEANLADTFGTADSEKIGASSCKVAAGDRKEFPLVFSSNYTEGLLEDHAELDAIVAESIQAENMTFSATAADYVPCEASADDVDFVYTVQDLICSPSNDTLNSGTEDPRNEGLARNEPDSPECLEEPEAEDETAQLGVAPNDFDPPSYNWTSSYESNSDMINGVHNSLAGEVINSLPAGNITRSSGISDQELESECIHQTHLVKGGEDALSSPAVHSDPESSTEHPLVLPADQLEGHLSEKIQSPSSTAQERLFNDLSLSRQEDHASVPLPSGYLQQSTGEELNNTIAEMDPLRSVIPSIGLLPGADQVNLEEMPPLPPLPPMQWRLGKIEHASLFLQGESRDHTPDSVPLILPVRDHEEVQSAFQAHQSDLLQLKNPSSSGNAAEVENSQIASEQVGNVMQPKDANSETNSHDSNGTQCLNPFFMLSELPDEKPEHGFLALEHEVVQSSSEPLLSLSAGEDTVSKYEAVSSPKKLIHALSQSASEPGLRHTLENLEGEQGNPSDASVLPPRKVEDTASDSVSSPEQLIHTSQPASEPGLQNTSESLECEHANPSDTSILPPENIGEAASIYDPGSLLEKSISSLNQSAPEPEHGNPSNTYVPSPRKAEEQPQNSLPSSLGESAWPSNPFAPLATSELVQENRSSIVKLPRPRSPLIDAVAAHDKSKLRKVTERVRPQSEPKVDERNSLLEQIRTKSFNLKPAVVSRPSVQGPKTNLRVAAILEKANAIRQATAGSDEDDEDWSE